MKEISVENPIHIMEAFYEQSDVGLMTVAAFVLAAGARQMRDRFEYEMLPEEDLSAIGLVEWWNQEDISQKRSIFAEFFSDQNRENVDSERHRSILAEMVSSAVNEPAGNGTLCAVAEGTRSEDDLIRICALISATELFQISQIELIEQFNWFFSRELNPATQELLKIGNRGQTPIIRIGLELTEWSANDPKRPCISYENS